MYDIYENGHSKCLFLKMKNNLWYMITYFDIFRNYFFNDV